MPRLVTYAQNREDIILYRFFADVEKGTYIDVGANYPEHYSVTKFFYDRGWTGVNIEPIKRLHQLFVASRPKDTNLDIAVGETEGVLTLREYIDGDGLSTLSKEMKEDYESGVHDLANKYVDYQVKVETLKNIFKENKLKDVQFIKIDVEGYEYEVLAGNDWNINRPELVCIEANHMIRNWKDLLESANYILVFFDGLNEYYLRSESMYRFEFFKKGYVNTILAQGVVDIDTQTEQDEMQKRLLITEEERDAIKIRVAHLEWESSRPKTLNESLRIVAVVINRKILHSIDKLKPKRIRQLNANININDDLDDLHRQIVDYDIQNEKILSGGMGIAALPYRVIMVCYRLLTKSAKFMMRRIR